MEEAGSDIGVRRQGFSFQDLLNQIIGSRGSMPARGGSRPTRGVGGSRPNREGGSRPSRGRGSRFRRGASRPSGGGSRPRMGGGSRPRMGGGSRTRSIGDITRGSGFRNASDMPMNQPTPADRSQEFDSLLADMKNRFGGKTPEQVEANLNKTDYFNFDRFEQMLNMSPEQRIEKLNQMQSRGEFDPRAAATQAVGDSFGGVPFGEGGIDRDRYNQFMSMTPEERESVIFKRGGTAKEDLKRAKEIIKMNAPKKRNQKANQTGVTPVKA